MAEDLKQAAVTNAFRQVYTHTYGNASYHVGQAVVFNTSTVSTVGYLLKLPQGFRLLGIDIIHEALGSSVTLDVGDGTTADVFVADADVAAAGTKSYVFNTLLSADTTILGTIAGATTAASDKTVQVIAKGIYEGVA